MTPREAKALAVTDRLAHRTPLELSPIPWTDEHTGNLLAVTKGPDLNRSVDQRRFNELRSQSKASRREARTIGWYGQVIRSPVRAELELDCEWKQAG